MPNHRSAEKQQRKDDVRRLRNQARKSRINTFVKKARLAFLEGTFEEKQEALRKAQSEIAKGAKTVLHKRTASRRISRLFKSFEKSQGTPASAA